MGGRWRGRFGNDHGRRRGGRRRRRHRRLRLRRRRLRSFRFGTPPETLLLRGGVIDVDRRRQLVDVLGGEDSSGDIVDIHFAFLLTLD